MVPHVDRISQTVFHKTNGQFCLVSVQLESQRIFAHWPEIGQITQVLINFYLEAVKNPFETTEYFKDIQGNCQLSVILDIFCFHYCIKF